MSDTFSITQEEARAIGEQLGKAAVAIAQKTVITKTECEKVCVNDRCREVCVTVTDISG